MHCSARVGFCCFLAVAFVYSPARSQAEAQPDERVQAELDALCETIRSGDDIYYGTAPVVAIEQRLAAADGAADAKTTVELRWQLGDEKLRLGDPVASIRELSAALQISAQSQLDRHVQIRLLEELGLAFLRFGEVSNCVAMHTAQMCIFPIGEGGRHSDQRGALDAIKAFRGVLSGAPDRVVARWLLNIAAMTVGEYPDAVPPPFRLSAQRLRADAAGIPKLEDVAVDVGLDIFDNAGGAAVDDFDGDGLLDVVTSSMNPCAPMHYYRGTRDADGKLSFASRIEGSGLEAQLGGLNLVHTDYNNDGHPDILVLRGGWFAEDGRMRNSLLRGIGDGRFEDVTSAVGLAEPALPTQTAAWADYDNDGDLDLFIGNEGEEGSAYPNQLLRNELHREGEEPGREAFVDVTANSGITSSAWTKGVAWGDYDNDGDPDLYVSNIGENQLYRNNGDGTFSDVAPQLGVTGPSGASFATWFFDWDNDGDLDLYVSSYEAGIEDVARYYFGDDVHRGHPVLYRNDLTEDGVIFHDVSLEIGLEAPAMPMGSNFGDLDNDGFLDLYLGTGRPGYETLAPNLLYHNQDGRRLVDVTFAAGVGHLQKGHGVVFADFDNDGDQDLFEEMGGAFPGDGYASVLYRNPLLDKSGPRTHWVKLMLEGVRSNRLGFGARLRLELESPTGERREIDRAVGSVSSFGSNPSLQEIGLGAAPVIRKLTVHWPASGTQQVFENVSVDRLYRVRELDDRLEPLELLRASLPSSSP